MIPRNELDLTGLRVLDGGLATELERAGCDLASPLWSGEVLRTQPEKVLAVHRSYLQAGADCLLTASYQLSAMGFREIGLTADDARRAIQQS
ncbi:MAG TPA: homocysteine S-methyltransferase family protein, partial [Edaphobacter sp.]|nr:homocysteine S-methyltransferase family protein [Edaphobacter sp.]